MNAALAVQLLLQLLTQTQAIAALLQKAQSEGRDVSDDEIQALASNDDAARAQLQAAIDQKSG